MRATTVNKKNGLRGDVDGLGEWLVWLFCRTPFCFIWCEWQRSTPKLKPVFFALASYFYYFCL